MFEFFNKPENSGILIGVFSLFIFIIITDKIGVKFIIYLILFAYIISYPLFPLSWILIN